MPSLNVLLLWFQVTSLYVLFVIVLNYLAGMNTISGPVAISDPFNNMANHFLICMTQTWQFLLTCYVARR